MLDRFDWWGYAILAAIPAATFMLGVLWARRELRLGRDPAGSESFRFGRWRRVLEPDSPTGVLESDMASLKQRLASLEQAVAHRTPTPIERVPTPV